MKNNKQKKHMISGKTKEEKRRLAFAKRNVKKEQNLARYGAEGGSALVKAKTADFNRRFVAAFLALVFAISCLVVGVNFATKAEEDSDGYDMYESEETNGLVTRKGLKYDETTGTYSLKMEAYATKPISTKTLDTDTPLDIVMVMDQGSTMSTKDILTGEGYQEVDSQSFSISDINDNEYYYYDESDDEWHRVYTDIEDGVEDNYVAVSDSPSWTAQSANTWYRNHNRRNLYYLNENDVYETVYTSAVDWYKNAGTIDAKNLVSYGDLWYKVNNTDIGEYYYNSNDNSNGDINTTEPFWHRVYENTRGVNLDGYYIYFWYYSYGDTFSDGTTLDQNSRSTTSYNDAITAKTIIRIPNSPYTSGSYAPYDAYRSAVYSNKNYTGGQLYTRQPNTSVLNKMWTSTDDSSVDNKTEISMLAWPLPGSTSTCPGSSTYTGTLYTAGYVPYYTNNAGNRVYIGKAVYTQSADAYILSEQDNIPLYEKETITRLKASQLSATEIAEQIAGIASDDVDHRIAIVGFADSGTIKTDLVSVAGTTDDPVTDEDPANDVNDTIDTAIASLSASGGSSLEAGLTTAQTVFAGNTYSESDSRKRIVLVFTDDDSAAGDELSASAVLKDTYNADVYTIRVNSDTASSTIQNYFTHLSSEYFATATNPIVETQNTDGLTYAYYGTDKASLLTGSGNAITTIFAQINSTRKTTTTLSTANAELRDIISSYFDVETNPTITIQNATSSYDSTTQTYSWPIDATASGTSSWDSANKTLTVTGFDYSANYVSPSHTGKKIIVTLSGLTLKSNVKTDSDKRIYTNTTASGIYKTGTEETLYGAFPRPFVDETSEMVPAGSSGKPDATSGIVVNKYLTAKENGKYDLTVETYTTKTSTEVKEKVPTDFIVVADQSGSMSTQDMATAYTSASDAYLETIATSSNGYYYYDSDTGNYYRVYPVKGYLYQYYAANTKWAQDVIEEGGMDLSWFQGSTDATYSVANQYYYKTSDGVYRPVGVSATGKLGTYYVKLHYTDANGDTVYFVRPTYPVYKNVFGSGKYQYGDLGYRAINAAVTGAYSDPEAYTYSKFLGITTGMYINYPMYKRRVGYTELRYRDVNGVEHTVPAKNGSTTWEYCNSSKQALTTASGSTRPTYSGLYQASNKITRLEALQNALTNFVTAVANEKDDVNDPVGNRIAIVGFSSDGFNNTELLTGENLDISGTDGTQKTTADENASAHYGTALVDATDGHTGVVNPKITAAIRALTASGGTQPEDGLDMAYNILTNRSQKTYTVQSSGNSETIDRNVFVIFFTDGQPGDYPFSNMYREANDVVETAKLIKDYRVGDTSVSADRVIIPSLFSIGVFGESDGNPLTYAAHKEDSLKTAYEYEPGWMETFDAYNYSHSATGGYRYQYLNRNWLPSDEENYGTTPNDTIYDYMSVVSSNYPNATKFMNVKSSNTAGEADTTGYTNYLGMVSGVRGDSIGSNRYYRMASNQDTLVGAFEQAVTMTNQTISSNQRLDSSSIMRDIFDDNNFKTSTDTTAKTHTVNGSMDKNGIVNFDESTRTSINLPATIGTVNGKTTVDVTGFDYLANYINYGNDGKKLVLTITNIEPKAGVVSTNETPKVYSNDVASAMYVNNTNKVNNTEFPTPAITRHRYTLDVGEVNTSATFDVAVKILDSDEEVVAKDDDMLEDVMLVYPDGTRAKYSEVGGQTFLAMKNGESFYLENLPPDTCLVQTEVTATDDAYNYSIYYDSDASTNAESMEKGKAKTHPFAYKDSTIHIISTRGSKAVTIREETTGSYGDLTRVFDEIITMDMPVISETTDKEKFSFNCTFNDDYSSFDDDLPKNADSYTAVFGKVTQDDGTIFTKLIRIDSVKGNDTYSKTITDGKFPMKHGDVMTLTNVPSGNTVKVQEDDSFDHDLFYYYGQDNISPSDIRLKTTTGSLMEGTHTFTLRPVDGTDGSDLTLTFVDGVVTNPSAEIDLGLYQRASVVNDDMSEAVLDIAGTTFTFDTETSDADIAYVTTIKQLAYDPPVQVTVDKTDMDILVVNRIGDIAVTGIFDDSQHNWVIYVLAGIAILSAGAGAAYVYRRKRLTTER